MKKKIGMKKKILTLSLALALCVVAMIGGTLAYFTDTDNKTNTFTVGKVDITLTEPDWNEDQARLIPGREIPKDPTITVADDSERAYTFMKVRLSSDLMELIKAYYGEEYNFIENYKTVISDWFVTTVSPKIMDIDLENGSVILGVLSPKDPGQSVTYFDAVKIPSGVDGSMINPNGSYEIEVTAYGIQAEGFEGAGITAQDARQAAYNALFTTASN